MPGRGIIIFTVAVVLLITSCSRRPSDVPDEDEMASLLADMHKAEAYASTDPAYAMNDSMRMVLRQGVLVDHGMDEKGFEKSLDWYGHNIDLLGDVYERTEEILKAEAEKGTPVTDKDKGEKEKNKDKNNLWNGSARASLSRRVGDTHLRFDIKGEEVKDASRLEWTFTVPAMPGRVTAFMGVDYADGTYSYEAATFNLPGLQRMEISPYRNRGKILRVFGQTTFIPYGKDEILLVDSITLKKL